MAAKKIVIVDDEKDYREGLKDFLRRDGDIVTFSHPDEFAESHQTPESLKDVYLIILDFCFDTFDANDKDLASYIRQDLAFKKNLVLWSLEDDIPKDFKTHFDAVLPKKLMSLPEIELCIKQQ